MTFKGPPNSRNRQLSKDNSHFECTLSIHIKKKMANVVEPYDNIRNTLANFKLLFNTKIM